MVAPVGQVNNGAVAGGFAVKEWELAGGPARPRSEFCS